MHLDTSISGVEFRKTEVGPGEERWGRMLGCHVLCRKCRVEEVRILVAGIPCLHLLPNMVTVVRRAGIVCSPHPDMERRETGVVWISLSIFCPYFLEVEHTDASFPKPLLRIAAWDAVVSTAEFTAFLIQ